MCGLAASLAFVLAHLVACCVLGGGWRGAARAPFLVFPPTLALIFLDGVVYDNFAQVAPKAVTLLTWELLYLFCYVFMRLMMRTPGGAQALTSIVPMRLPTDGGAG